MYRDCVTTTTPVPPLCPKLTFTMHRRMAGKYEVLTMNESTIHFKCLHNYHLWSGHLVSHCQEDGNWSGIEPLCQVDYYKDKRLLSIFITSTVVLIFAIFLAVDYSSFMQRRERHREERRRYRVYAERRKNLYRNPRLSYPNTLTKEDVQLAGLHAVIEVRAKAAARRLANANLANRPSAMDFPGQLDQEDGVERSRSTLGAVRHVQSFLPASDRQLQRQDVLIFNMFQHTRV